MYLLPLTPDFIKEVIEKERPDGIMLQFGGQTALNCGVELDQRGASCVHTYMVLRHELRFSPVSFLFFFLLLPLLGILSHHGVRVLGTSVPSIIATEDREIFANKLTDIGEKIAQSKAAVTPEEAIKAANEIGYPVIVRAAFSLGGLGSGFAHDDAQLRTLCSRAFSSCPQVGFRRKMRTWAFSMHS